VQKIHNFLKNHNIINYQIIPLAGDASARRYFRLKFLDNSPTKIIMDCPKDEGLEKFCQIDKILIKENLYAPKIFYQDLENGLLLLEDLGNNTAKKFIAKNLQKEEKIYFQATKILLDLHQAKAKRYQIDQYGSDVLLREVNLFVEWYLPNIKKTSLSGEELAEWQNFWLELFSQISSNKVICLRDYHSENLMITNNHQIALIDFQDALIGSPSYDLQSLLEDIRRNIDESLAQKMFNFYLENSPFKKEEIIKDYQILSLQRNIKIIGIFTRLSCRDGKHKYLDFLPKLIDLVKNRLKYTLVPKSISRYL
jgi:aminoglycoside/choline kinase family phosphotransferase